MPFPSPIARQAAFGLGIFSIALGLTELLASRRITAALGAEGREGLVKAYGAREIVAGVGLLQAPAHSTRMWNRVGSDALDLATLAPLAWKQPRSAAVWGAVAFVVAAGVIDTVVASALSRVPEVPGSAG